MSTAASGATNRLGLGDKIRLVPGHCDPNVNLYGWYVGIRDNSEYFVVDGPAMTAETRADGGLGAQPYRWARVTPRT